MNIKYIKVTLFLFGTVFYGCKPDMIERGIIGKWSFDQITYNDSNIMSCLYNNMFTFKRDYELELPEISNYCEKAPGSEIVNGRWKILVKPDKRAYVYIKTANKAFNNKYQITFYKDKGNGMLKAVLNSKQMKIIMRTGSFNPEYQGDIIDELIKLTN